jgi:hypothetical protein
LAVARFVWSWIFGRKKSPLVGGLERIMNTWLLAIIFKPLLLFAFLMFVWACHFAVGKLPDSWFKRLLLRRWLERLDRCTRKPTKPTTD